MLAFILLVVLGGGLGLLAVSLAESPKPATDRGLGRRAPDSDIGLREPTDGSADVADTASTVDEEEASFETELAEVFAPPATVGPGPAPRRRPDPRQVPAAYTAIEGRFDTVAVPPIWRRLLSLCAVVLLAVVLGIGVAAVAAAVIGAVAELLNTAVG